MNDVAPRRNLPPEAEAWGRWIEDQIRALVSSTLTAQRTAVGAQSAQGGLVGAIAAQAEALRDTQGLVSGFDALANADIVPLAPSKPRLVTRPGTVSVGWDGLLGGLPPERNFGCVVADLSFDAGLTWERAGQSLSTAGVMVVALLDGTEAWFRLVAMNNAGKTSAPSPVAFSLVGQLVSNGNIGN